MPYRQLSGVEISRGPVTLFGKSARSALCKSSGLSYWARDVGRAFYRGGGEREREREAANCARATLKDLTEKIGPIFRNVWPSETRSCAGSTRIDESYAGPHL